MGTEIPGFIQAKYSYHRRISLILLSLVLSNIRSRNVTGKGWTQAGLGTM